MKKLLISVALIFLSTNINAAISQSGITNLKQLDKNGIIDLVSGNQLTGFISDGPFEGPIKQTYFRDGRYETIYDDRVFKGKWRAEGESYATPQGKKMCTKNNNATDWSCFYWYTGNKDGRTYAYIIAQGLIFHQYHKVESANNNQKVKNTSSSSLSLAASESYKPKKSITTTFTKVEVKKNKSNDRDKVVAEMIKKKKAEDKEIKRIANIKKIKKTIEKELKKLNDNFKKLQNLKLDKLKLKANTLISEIEKNTYSDLAMLFSFHQRLVKINSSIDKEEKRIADAKKAAEKKKAAELKRIADAKKAAEKRKASEEKIRISDAKRAQEKKKAEDKEIKRIANIKRIKKTIADEKLKIALSLIPSQTKLQNAQNFVDDILKFVESYPNEFDIMDVAMFKINTKLISEGIFDDQQMGHIDSFKELVRTSSAFKKFQKMKENERKQLEIKRISQLIESIKDRVNYLKEAIYTVPSSKSLINKTVKSAQYILDNPGSFSALQVLDNDLAKLTKDLKTEKAKNAKIRYALLNLDKRTSKLKTYLSENLSSISTELMTSIVVKVNLIEGIKKQAFTNKNEELRALKKVNDEIASFILNNNLVTTADISAIKKVEKDKKKATEKKKVADAKKKVTDAKKKADDKERARLKNFKTVSMSCSYSINNRYYSYDWAYDGKKLYFGGIPIYIGNNKVQDMSITVRKLSGRDQFNIRVDVSSLASEYNLGIASANMNFFYDFKNDFYNESSEMTDDGMKGFGNCY